MQPGDLITRIDDKPVRGLPLEQAVKRMRGEPGTKVTLTIYRKSEERTFPVCLLYTSPSPRDGLLSRMPSSA